MTANTEAIFDGVVRIIRRELGLQDGRDIYSSTTLDDLGADSLDLVEIVMVCEEEYNISISDEQTDRIKTVGDLAAIVETENL